MATLALQVSDEGISAPSYEDILQQLRILYWGIYGNDAILDADSQDGQFLAVIAQGIYDCNQAGIAVFNSFRPGFAQGAGLSSIVKINGLQRLVSSNSTAVVKIIGQVGTVITSGIIGDDLSLGTQWALPETVTIPLAGEIDVTATCTTAGAITAAENSLTVILTPTRGWQTVNNALEAVPGAPVESDATLRRRQSVSTANPSQTIIESITAGLANLGGVQRLLVYENDTDSTDADGIPSHSIAAVVQGGDTVEIAETIAARKSPGTGTAGSVTEIVIDSAGMPNTIRFYPLDLVTIEVEVTIEELAGYVSTTADLIKEAVSDFISNLSIGETVYHSRLFTPANLESTGVGKTFVVTAITLNKTGDPPGTADIDIDFNAAAVATTDNVTVTVAP